ncbi:hypothetical protein NSZ01_00860 [Nocardioides szechwanensis]|nr:hypothetical protein NSZ01_00860 [Nocardioides szechwanensis]
MRLLLLALALAVLATLTAPASLAQARVDPSTDYPRLPPRCEGDLHKIPTKPGVCFVTEFRKARPTVVIWGDSHAWQYVPALQAAAKARRANLVGFFMGGCPPVKVPLQAPPGGYASICEKHNAMAMKFVKKLEAGPQDVRVVLGSSWAGYRRADREIKAGAGEAYYGYNDWVKQMVALFMRSAGPLFPALGKVGVDVDVIGQTATVPRSLAPCATGEDPYTCDLRRNSAIYDEYKTRKWLRGLMKELAGKPRLIEVNDAFCDDYVCHGMVDDVYTFYDDLHLSATKVRQLRPYFRDTFRALR